MKKNFLNNFNKIGLTLQISSLILSFIYFLFHLTLDEYNFTSFYITYEKGFISRGFIGTLCLLFPNNFFIPCVLGFVSISILFIFICYISNLIKTYKITSINTKFWILSLLNSSTIYYFLILNHHLKLEVFWFVIYMIFYQLFLNYKDKYFSIILILSIVGTLIHQGFVFVTMPFVLMYLLEYKKKNQVIIYLLLMGFTFLICQFLGKIDYTIITQYVGERALETNFFDYMKDTPNGVSKMLYLEYNTSIFNHMKLLIEEMLNVNIPLFIEVFFANIFNIIVLLFLYCNIYKKKDIKYFILLIITQIPLYILTIDIERWFILFLFNLQLFLLNKIQRDRYNLDEIFISKLHILSYLLSFIFVINYITLHI